MADDLKAALAARNAWRTMANARGRLLICYRMGLKGRRVESALEAVRKAEDRLRKLGEIE